MESPRRVARGDAQRGILRGEKETTLPTFRRWIACVLVYLLLLRSGDSRRSPRGTPMGHCLDRHPTGDEAPAGAPDHCRCRSTRDPGWHG